MIIPSQCRLSEVVDGFRDEPEMVIIAVEAAITVQDAGSSMTVVARGCSRPGCAVAAGSSAAGILRACPRSP